MQLTAKTRFSQRKLPAARVSLHQTFLRAKTVPEDLQAQSLIPLTSAAPELGLTPALPESTIFAGLCHEVCPLRNAGERTPSRCKTENSPGKRGSGTLRHVSPLREGEHPAKPLRMVSTFPATHGGSVLSSRAPHRESRGHHSQSSTSDTQDSPALGTGGT